MAPGRWGAAPKVSDEEVIKIMDEFDGPVFMPGSGEKVCDRMAYRREDLVFELMERGMSRTPALKRIETMVRRGVFCQGTNPWPRKYPTPGIYVWMNREREPEEKEPEGPDFFTLLASLAFSEETALSLRAIQRELKTMSIATVSRRMKPLVDAGRVRVCDAGYYAVMEPASEIG